MKYLFTLLLVLQFNFYLLYSQNSNSDNKSGNTINTKSMVQGDYRYSPVYILTQFIDTNIKEVKLVSFVDSVPLNFVSEGDIWIKQNCPDCSYTGPVIDHDKSKRILIYLINLSDSAIKINTQDMTLQVIQEAKDSSGNWMPIEYWVMSSCFHSYSTKIIPANHYISTTGYRYTGNFLTEVRFKMVIDGYTVVSDLLYSYINYSQFKKPDKTRSVTFF